jgi:DNA-binding MurR/RpiR family transcriptional regulator
MKALYSGLSKSERRVVNFISEHPQEVIYLSVSDLAEKSCVSSATVVRTCHKVGLNGYQDLKLTLAQDIVTPLQAIHEDIDYSDSDDVICDKVFQSVIHSLEFTRETLNVEQIRMASELLLKSRRIRIFGMGNSYAITIDFQHKLMRLGLDAMACGDSHMQMIAASSMTKDDCAVAISHSGSSKEVVDSIEVARGNRAKIISITNLGKSPISDISDISIHTASQETKYRILALSSRVAQLAIIDSIYTIMAIKKGDAAIRQFHKMETALSKTKY